jgi:hypothetical protein
MSASDAPLSVPLSPDEALVLFEFLSRYEENERLTIEDSAEDRVLTTLLSRLESHLVSPFSPHYRELLASARARVRESQG